MSITTSGSPGLELFKWICINIALRGMGIIVFLSALGSALSVRIERRVGERLRIPTSSSWVTLFAGAIEMTVESPVILKVTFGAPTMGNLNRIVSVTCSRLLKQNASRQSVILEPD
ncbi:hypothetical protein B0H14DRAFT_2598188 [Mycena olivaceomarginata]|nr:hypothetical protein B0H14DRAFT_2598188 [Mycena olivaceomarginata]